MRWPKYWSFTFSIIPFKETPGLISFRMDWLDLLAVQRTLKSLLQHHSSKGSILLHSDFFTVQLSHPYMNTGKTIAVTIWTLFGKVMSLLLNILSRLVITFLPRSKCLNFMAAFTICSDFGAQENKVYHCFHCLPYEVMGPDTMLLVFEYRVLNQLFHTPLSLSSKGSLVPLCFCHKGGGICISDVIDIFSCNLDPSLCFIPSCISHDVLCI